MKLNNTRHIWVDEVGRVSVILPGLAVGESMDRDSLLPPALSESLHIPPPWLAAAHGRKGV